MLRMKLARKPFFKALIKVFVILFMVFVGWKALEFTSRKILQHKGWLSNGAQLNQHMYGRKVNFWAVSENAHNYHSEGLEADLKTPGTIYMDANGFVTGDTLGLSREKKPGVIRIFLTGGSAMFGSLANRKATGSNVYPESSYYYDASIAGRLKEVLKARYPGLQFEVVNAAVVQHQFNQNYAMYYQRFHDFSPDVIINMDGYNDRFGNGDDPYLSAGFQIEEERRLEVIKGFSRYGYTAALLSSALYKPGREDYNDGGSEAAFLKSWAKEDTTRLMAELTKCKSSAAGFVEEQEKMNAYIGHTLKKQMWLTQSYIQQLAMDSVYSIYCLQPMLERQDKQKHLSNIEEQLLNGCNRYYYSSGMYDTTGTDMKNLSSSYFIYKYYMAYYLGHYYAPALDSIVKNAGGNFIDMNAEIEQEPAGKEFYVDYCHLTPYGNTVIAQKFADKLDAYIKSRAGTYLK